MTDEEEVCFSFFIIENINDPSLQIPLGELGDLSTECKPKPHKHIALGFCRKQQVRILNVATTQHTEFTVLHTFFMLHMSTSYWISIILYHHTISL